MSLVDLGRLSPIMSGGDGPWVEKKEGRMGEYMDKFGGDGEGS